MKKTFQPLLFLVVLTLIMNCQPEKHEDDNINIPSDTAYQGNNKIVVNFEYGEDLSQTAGNNIYVIWIENETSGFMQNIGICKKLIAGGLTGTALPYWKTNKYPNFTKTEIDAVTSATISNTDFSVSAQINDSTVRKFTLYFETDRSFDPNDWFSDQPALLYSADIDLDNVSSEYELIPIGWTPNENTENVIQNTPMGKLQTELKYITNFKEGTSFGLADSRNATQMVKKITAKIE